MFMGIFWELITCEYSLFESTWHSLLKMEPKTELIIKCCLMTLCCWVVRYRIRLFVNNSVFTKLFLQSVDFFIPLASNYSYWRIFVSLPFAGYNFPVAIGSNTCPSKLRPLPALSGPSVRLFLSAVSRRLEVDLVVGVPPYSFTDCQGWEDFRSSARSLDVSSYVCGGHASF